MKRFRFTGICLVPMEVSIEVLAKNDYVAGRRAYKELRKRNGLKDHIVPDSQDISSAHGLGMLNFEEIEDQKEAKDQ